MRKQQKNIQKNTIIKYFKNVKYIKDMVSKEPDIESNQRRQLSIHENLGGIDDACDLTPPDSARQSDNSNQNSSSFQSVEMQTDDLMESGSSIDSPSILECEVAPDIVEFINSSSPERAASNEEINSSPGKRRRIKANRSHELILHTIEQYNKHLKSRDAFKGILKDESLSLLSSLTLESEDAKMIISSMYLYKGVYLRELDISMWPSNIKDVYASLYQKGFTAVSPTDTDQYTLDKLSKQLSEAQLKAVCKNFNPRNSPKNKDECIHALRIYTQVQDIRPFFNGSRSDRKSEFLNYMILLIEKWNLSELAHETITELMVLMHLDIIFKISYSIDFTNTHNDRPEIRFKSPNSKKSYRVDKNMIVDDASIIFQDRNQFCTYLEALALKNAYTMKNEDDIVSRALQLYKNATPETMHRYKALPPWLRRFTAVHVYLELMEKDLKRLKKSEKIEKALEILDLLIQQPAYKEHKKADYYENKIKFQKCPSNSLKTKASILQEAFNADLSEENVNGLRVRAKKITDRAHNRHIDEKLLKALKRHGEKAKFERDINSTSTTVTYDPRHVTVSGKKKRYKWGNEDNLSAEEYCCKYLKEIGQFTLAKYFEGRLMEKLYLMLFNDIIYAKPVGIPGIFMSHCQEYPVDMFCESFYINRKAIINDFLATLEKSSADDIIEMIKRQYREPQRDNARNKYTTITTDNITTVVRCLGSRALAAICRRFAQNYAFARNGFPDLTLCNEERLTIEFREVKTDSDTLASQQILWLEYLIDHEIQAGLCSLTPE